jgi:hypothetical protein
MIMGPITDFLADYLAAAAPAWPGDPGLKGSQRPMGGALSVFEISIRGGPPLHVHDREDECFCVLDHESSNC